MKHSHSLQFRSRLRGSFSQGSVSRRGFTLLDGLALVLVIGAAIWMTFSINADVPHNSQCQDLAKQMNDIESVLEKYHDAFGRYPDNREFNHGSGAKLSRLSVYALGYQDSLTKVRTLVDHLVTVGVMSPQERDDFGWRDCGFLDPWGYDWRYVCEHTQDDQQYRFGSRGPDGLWGNQIGGGNGMREGKHVWGEKDDITNFTPMKGQR